jgi:hypothetical protein
VSRIDVNDPHPNEFLEQVSRCYGLLRSRVAEPCLLELIWSYWKEEGMLVQAMNSITGRFQNIRGPLDNDPGQYEDRSPAAAQ